MKKKKGSSISMEKSSFGGDSRRCVSLKRGLQKIEIFIIHLVASGRAFSTLVGQGVGILVALNFGVPRAPEGSQFPSLLDGALRLHYPLDELPILLWERDPVDSVKTVLAIGDMEGVFLALVEIEHVVENTTGKKLAHIVGALTQPN